MPNVNEESLRALGRIASRRHGVFRRDHVQEVGMAKSSFDRLVRKGLVHRIHRRSYAFGCPPLGERARWLAAVDACGDPAVLCGWAAGRLHEVIRRRADRIDVLVPRRHEPISGICIRQTRQLPKEDVTTVDGIPVVTVERLLVELAADGVDVGELCNVMDEGAYRRRFTAERMRQAMERHRNRRGRRRLAEALARHLDDEGGTMSAFEARVVSRMRSILRVAYECNRSRVIGGRRMKPDMLIPNLRIAIEADGMWGHARPTRQRDDRARDAAYRAGGYVVCRVRDTHEVEDLDAAVAFVMERQREVMATGVAVWGQ